MKAHEHLIKHALALGMTISVYDGEEWQVSRSTDEQEILDAVDSVEESQLKFRNSGDIAYRGAACVIPSLDDDETVVDYTCGGGDPLGILSHLWLMEWQALWDVTSEAEADTPTHLK